MLHALKTTATTLLRSSERYTKTDMVYLAGSGGWLVAAHIVMGLISLGLSIAFANLIPKDLYGNYRFLLSLFWILTAFSLTGIPSALTRAVARGEEGAYLSALKLSIAWSSPMALIGLGVSGYYFLNDNALLAFGSLCIALIGPFMQSAYLFGPFLEGKRAFKENALAGMVLTLLPALALVGSMFLFQNPALFLLVYLGANTLTGYGISYLMYQKYRPVDTGMSNDLKSLSAHFSVMNILASVSQHIDRLLVFHYVGAVELAVYTFATAIPDHIKVLFNNVGTVALPKFVKRSFDEVRSTLHYRMLGFTALTAVAAVTYIFLAPFLFQLFFPAYTESVAFSQLYAVALIPIANIIPLSLLEAHAAKRELYIFNVASPIFHIALLFFLVIGYGVWGVVVARIIGRFFNLALLTCLVHVRKRTAE